MDSRLDLINGMFEAGLAVLLLLNCRAIIRVKMVRGVSIAPFLFTTSWGVWNLLFYPALGCWFSFAGGLGVVAVNCCYCCLWWRYRNN